MSSKDIIVKLALEAGIEIGKDVQVNNEHFYDRLIKDGTLGLGESYMEGWWDVIPPLTLDELAYRVIKANLKTKLQSLSMMHKLKIASTWIRTHMPNVFQKKNSVEDSKQVALKHYDLGNEIYEGMLDSKMIYSCAYFSLLSSSLEGAQTFKLAKICNKLHIQKGDRVLDIGCGWGGLASFIATNYYDLEVQVDGLTISKEQYEYAIKKHIISSNNNNIDKRLHFYLEDYRTFMQTCNKTEHYYDKIVSVGCFEHIGEPQYQEFMQVVDKLLKPGGLFLLHTIGANKPVEQNDPWIEKYIFPNSYLPCVSQITKCTEKQEFILEDIENFGPQYDLTLMNWYQNFHKNFDQINSNRVAAGKEPLGDTFVRMWDYYLLICAGTFRARNNQLFQFVFSKKALQTYTRH